MIDWTKAPEWANYAAMDESGGAHFFQDKPARKNCFWDDDDGKYTEIPEYLRPCFGADWKDSLQERPKADIQDVPYGKQLQDAFQRGELRPRETATLRDQFAMAALTGLLTREDTNLESDPEDEEYSAWDEVAQAAYFLGAAMIREREK